MKEITLLGQIVTSYGRREGDLPLGQDATRVPPASRRLRATARSRSRDRRAGAHPLHLAAPEGLRRRSGGGLRAAAQTGGERAHPGAKRQRPRAEAHAPRLHARAVPEHYREAAPRRSRASASARTSSSAFPARRRRTSRKRSRWRARSSSTRPIVFKYSQRRDTPAAAMPGPGAAGGEGGAQPAVARTGERNRPRADTRRSSASRCRFWSKGRARRIRRA